MRNVGPFDLEFLTAAIARVRIVPGEGKVVINGKAGDLYLQFNPTYIAGVKAPLETLGLENEYDVLVNAHGGGVTGQADCISLGVARALCELAPENRKPLKVEGYMTRDPVVRNVKNMGSRKLVKLLNTRNGNQ